MQIPQLRLLSDQPITENDEAERDCLGFHTYARVLTGAALSTTGPFTIGIFGEWGTGKTSLMRLMVKQLHGNRDVVTVWFNAWRYEQEEHPIVALVATIIKALESAEDERTHFRAQRRSLAMALRALAYGFSTKAKVGIPSLAEVEAAFVAKDMIERAEKIYPDPLLDSSLYYEAYQTLNQVASKSDAKIVVLIDDLDRCFPDQAIKLLESLKLVLCQPGFIFVLGVSQQVLRSYLEHRYRKEFGLRDFDGGSYLDKIIQLPFYMPLHRDRMADLINKLLEAFAEEERHSLSVLLPTIAVATGSNPRVTVRLVNNLLVDRAISLALNKNIPIGYFAITRALQQSWPEAFSLLIKNKDLCSRMTTWDQRGPLEHASSREFDEARVSKIMSIDNELRELMLSDHGKAWLGEHSQRDSAIQFLQNKRQEPSLMSDSSRSYPHAVIVFADSDLASATRTASLLNASGVPTSLCPFRDTHLNVTAESSVVWILGSEVASPQNLAVLLADISVASEIHFLTLPGTKYDHIPGLISHDQLIKLGDDRITGDRLEPIIMALLRRQGRRATSRSTSASGSR